MKHQHQQDHHLHLHSLQHQIQQQVQRRLARLRWHQHVVVDIVEAGGGLLAISEGWHRGPGATPMDDPSQMGATMMDLQAKARKNAGMNGVDLD